MLVLKVYKKNHPFPYLEDEMSGRAVVIGISTEAFTSVGPFVVVCASSAGAVILLPIGAGFVVGPQACIRLSSNADPVANFDMINVLANADSLANDLVADDTRVKDLAPSATQGVQVCATHATVRDAYVDVVIRE